MSDTPPSPHTSPILFTGGRVFAVNTPSDTVDVVDSGTLEIIARIDVGIDPVTLAVRPDGREVWVSNHVSDSVSVIDVVPVSPTYLQVVATIQEFDLAPRLLVLTNHAGLHLLAIVKPMSLCHPRMKLRSSMLHPAKFRNDSKSLLRILAQSLCEVTGFLSCHLNPTTRPSFLVDPKLMEKLVTCP